MDDQATRRQLHLHLPDQMRHFARDGPVTKLLALLICKLPALVAVVVLCASLVAKVAVWFP